MGCPSGVALITALAHLPARAGKTKVPANQTDLKLAQMSKSKTEFKLDQYWFSMTYILGYMDQYWLSMPYIFHQTCEPELVPHSL